MNGTTASGQAACPSSNIFKRVAYYMNPSKLEPKRRVLWSFWILFNVALYLLPNDLVRGSILCLLPTVGLFTYAIASKNVYEAIVLGTVANYIMWYKGGFVAAFVENTVASVCDPETTLMIVSFLLCGGMIVMFTRSGVTKAFGELIVRKCEVDPAAPYWLSPAVSAEPPPEPDLHVSAYPAPSAITITVLGQV